MHTLFVKNIHVSLTICVVSFFDSSVVSNVFSLIVESVQLLSDLCRLEAAVLIDDALSLILVAGLSFRLPPVFDFALNFKVTLDIVNNKTT